MSEPTTDDADVRFDAFGFRPLGRDRGHLVEPARCACGITAQYASPQFGFLCAPCFQKWKADHA